MANYHANILAIAANEENMRQVLIRMGMNLAANNEYTGFDISNLVDLETAKDIYYEVGPVIASSYIFAFTGAPLPEVIESNAALGWASSTSSEDGFNEQMRAISQAFEMFGAQQKDGMIVEAVSAAPVGRPMSDCAWVEFGRYGENWLLTINYDTAWSPNSEDLDIFFMGLSHGDYGVAFYDADEYDGYETVSVFCGLHHGRGTMHAIEGERDWDTLDIDALKNLNREYSRISKSDVMDLGELAKIGATSFWIKQVAEEYDEDEDCEDYAFSDEADESINLWDKPQIEWDNPKNKDLRRINELIIKAISCFPWTHRPDGGFTQKGNSAAECLFPGDDIVVTSDWSARAASGRVIFRVYDTNENLIGIMGSEMELFDDWKSVRYSSEVLACLLPHLRTTVWELIPVSLRSTVQSPKLSIRFELEVLNADDIFDEVRSLLDKDRKDRSCSSKGGSSDG